MKTNFISLVDSLALILRGGATYWRGHYRDYQSCPARDWHGREQRKYPMHPAVLRALESDYRPYDWHALTLEWPHVSEDSTRLAYTRDDRAGEADRQTVTTVGKYLTRHFRDMPDHEVRNLVALYAAGESCKWVYTMAEMLHHILRGPTSCMGGDKSFDIRCADGTRRHPYQVYDPKYGWHMAVRIENDDTVGRALCMSDGDSKYFVRSYRKNPDGYSPADERLEAWLIAQGYTKQSYWESDTRLAYYEVNSGEILAPYIDGGNQDVDLCGNHLEICSDGEYECSQTSGIAQDSNGDSCNDCGDRIREGDGYWVERYEETHVCQSCCDNDYYYAYGARGNQYYVHRDHVVHVGDEVYDENHLSDNEIVELENGDYASMDDCVLINDEWYLTDDERVCHAEDIEDYCLTEDCWRCEESGNWYTDDTACVEIDGSLYHPDHAPEQETTEGE
jgi:hypothetical protein